MTFSLFNKMEFIEQIHPNISLQRYNEISMIVVEHNTGKAIISLQGAQLLSWQPKSSAQDLLWLSDAEPFKQGVAIRGGIPLCYPWFGGAQQPAHGFARIRQWVLSDWQVSEHEVKLIFGLYSENNIAIARVRMSFAEDCRVKFTQLAKDEAQVALHTYFNIGDIEQTTIFGLPKQCMDRVADAVIEVPSPLTISKHTDYIYSGENRINHIEDKANKRFIEVEHHNASNVVVWNPWTAPTSAISENGYRTMLCVETARVDEKLKQGDSLEVRIIQQ
ncbi:aldose epimerase [Gallibacterium salpingitidis]|uniref:Putative glucose-6-phosphate 1-epimerase n=1 Tax=Gallibacterium salpingitidis TaxID=505341 RepID=A0AB36DZZ3_9PAST|nr:D-hexose-6-phosphate mutarotase [Gallibacterium salpingitidis]OBX07556.1 aldose epimerase [Gallibacterium salpingitidis]OBX09428.1 aldose epimerase [Gallibacterium salpingitidis]